MSRLLTGGIASALVISMAALVPTGAGAASGSGHGNEPGKRPAPDSRALASASARAFIESAAPGLHKSKYDGFTPRAVISSAGLQYVPYERTYRGLPVIGGDFVVTTDERGVILHTSVAQTAVTRLANTQPTVAKAAARATSRARVHGPDKQVGGSRLVVVQGKRSHLAWETTVSGTDDHGHRSIQSVYVDARTGRLLRTVEHVLNGSGNAAYSGPSPLTLNTSVSGSTYAMKDPATPSRVCQNSATNATYTGTDDSWGDGNATSRETGCVDAFYATQVQKAMLNSWLGRAGMTSTGTWVPMRVGLDDINAYYDGTQVQIGHNNLGQWIGSMDVVAHEYGHGIDDNTPGGISGGGTQEFVGDVFGALTEAYANQSASYDAPDYLVGEEINLSGNGPIRNMYDPSQVGDPNCYSASIPSTEVHAAAGPGNHWFYLLAEGSAPVGKPASPTCNGSTLTGIGLQTAGKIFYNAMLMKTSTSSYLKYRTWTLTAAKNLYPGDCTNFNAVKAAWDAVKVPAQTADPTCSVAGNTVTVTNPGAQSSVVGTATSLQISASDSAPGQTLTYSATGLPAGLTINASTGLISGTPSTAGSYTVTVTARDTTGATGSASFGWTVSTGGGGGCVGQKIGNPGFETGSAAPWSATSGVVDNNAGQPAHSGTWKAWLNGYGASRTDTLTQSVSVPAGCRATLSFWLHVDSRETTTSTAYDKLTVKAGGQTLATYSNLNKAAGYQLRSFDVSALAGSTITISFTGVEDSYLATSFVIDDAALNLS